MNFSKKLVVLPVMGLVLLFSALLITSKVSLAVVDSENTENPYTIPIDNKFIDFISLDGTGSIHFYGLNKGTTEKPSYPGYMYGGIGFTTDGDNNFYRYTYTNNTPVSLNFALYSYDGVRVDDKYTTKSVAPGTTYVDVVRLDKNTKYCITAFAQNGKNIGSKEAKSLCYAKVSPLPDDVGDLITTATPIDISSTYEKNIQGRPDTDCFSIISPGTALAVTVQNRSDKAEDQLTVRVQDRNGNEVSNFTVNPGLIETKEVFKIQMQETSYVTVSAPKSNSNVLYDIKIDPVTRRIEYVLGSKNAVNDKNNPFVWSVGQVFSFGAPTRAGYIFDGWFTDKGFGESARITGITEAISTDITLYAKWIKFSVALPTGFSFSSDTNSVTISFTKDPNASYTRFTCNGKSYKTDENTVTISKLKPGKTYTVKVQSFWKIKGVGSCKSKVKKIQIKTSK